MENAAGFTESSGILSSLGLIFDENFSFFNFLWTSSRNKTYGSIYITARHLCYILKLRVLSSPTPLLRTRRGVISIASEGV
jgi:hypothetical protein